MRIDATEEGVLLHHLSAVTVGVQHQHRPLGVGAASENLNGASQATVLYCLAFAAKRLRGPTLGVANPLA